MGGGYSQEMPHLRMFAGVFVMLWLEGFRHFAGSKVVCYWKVGEVVI